MAREVEVQAEEESSFLARHLTQMQGGNLPGPPGRNESPMRQSPAVQKTADRRVSSTSSPSQMGSPKKVSNHNLYLGQILN